MVLVLHAGQWPRRLQLCVADPPTPQQWPVYMCCSSAIQWPSRLSCSHVLLISFLSSSSRASTSTFRCRSTHGHMVLVLHVTGPGA